MSAGGRELDAELVELYTGGAKRFALPEERERLGRELDPAEANVFFDYAQTLDPYGDDPDLPEELQQIGREYFAVTPDGIAVSFHDLPAKTVEALKEKQTQVDRKGWEVITTLAVG